jgi:hypothetical protein
VVCRVEIDLETDTTLLDLEDLSMALTDWLNDRDSVVQTSRLRFTIDPATILGDKP